MPHDLSRAAPRLLGLLGDGLLAALGLGVPGPAPRRPQLPHPKP